MTLDHEQIAQIALGFYDTYGFNPRLTYCLTTGKRVGELDSTEFSFLCDLLDSDLESAVDDLFMRVVGSMRPGPRFIKIDSDDWVKIYKATPIDAIAGLLNQLFDSDKLSWYTNHVNRIKLHAALTRQDVHESQREQVFGVLWAILIELKSKNNLHKLVAPCEFAKLNLDDSGLFNTLTTLLQPWAAKIMLEVARRESDGYFGLTDPRARKAFSNVLNGIRVPTPLQAEAEKKAKAKAAKLSTLESLFAELQTAMKTPATAPESVSKPTIAAAKAFAVASKMPTW